MRPLILASPRWVMPECPFQSRLSAFHDRELDAESASALSSHLSECPKCTEQLDAIRAISRLFGQTPAKPMSQIGMKRLHLLADKSARQAAEPFPYMRMLTALAASILVVAGAWLVESPAGTRGSLPGFDPQTPSWEIVARGGKLHFGSPLNVESDLARWMNDGLKDAASTPLLNSSAREGKS